MLRTPQHSMLVAQGLAVLLCLLFRLFVCFQSVKRLLSSMAVMLPELREGTTRTGQHRGILPRGCAHRSGAGTDSGRAWQGLVFAPAQQWS